MTMQDARLLDAKGIPVVELVDRLGISGLKTHGTELTGPCPLCGGRDRFNINLRTHAFLCRQCDIRGGDQVALVMAVRQIGFRAALDWLCGPATEIDPAELARRRARARAAEERQRASENRWRQQSIADARSIWSRSLPGSRGVVRAYLMARGITPDLLPDLPPALRMILDHPYVRKIDGRLETLHRGPAMIAGILDAEDRLTAVHQTWVDPQPPHGKARVTWRGEAQASKMTRGAVKGGAIRLLTPEEADTLIMGEGIETTLTAMVADAVPGAAYWAGVSLGNMAGKQDGRRTGRPLLEDDRAFVPPAWVRRLIYVQDGDSDPVSTRAQLLAGLRRAMALRPGLKAQIVHAGEGVDLNDVLVGEGESDGDS